MVTQIVLEWFKRFVDDTAKAIRHISAGLLVIFAGGVIVGQKIAIQHADSPQMAFAIIIPILLAMLAYAYTEFAVLVFILFVIGIILL